MHILIVEDDPTDLKLVSTILAAEGHEIAVARSAERALQMLGDGRPDLIVTDLALPEMDGVALTRKLKECRATADIPVVAVTAHTDLFPKRRAQREAGFAAFITKPIDPQTLPAMLAAACSRG